MGGVGGGVGGGIWPILNSRREKFGQHLEVGTCLHSKLSSVRIFTKSEAHFSRRHKILETDPRVSFGTALYFSPKELTTPNGVVGGERSAMRAAEGGEENFCSFHHLLLQKRAILRSLGRPFSFKKGPLFERR